MFQLKFKATDLTTIYFCTIFKGVNNCLTSIPCGSIVFLFCLFIWCSDLLCGCEPFYTLNMSVKQYLHVILCSFRTWCFCIAEYIIIWQTFLLEFLFSNIIVVVFVYRQIYVFIHATWRGNTVPEDTEDSLKVNPVSTYF